MSAEIARAEPAQRKTDAELEEDFARLHAQEMTQRGDLDLTIFAIGDLLVRWQPTRDKMKELARKYKVTVETLEKRQRVALNIPKAQRNSDLSWSGHVEALRVGDPEARL